MRLLITLHDLPAPPAADPRLALLLALLEAAGEQLETHLWLPDASHQGRAWEQLLPPRQLHRDPASTLQDCPELLRRELQGAALEALAPDLVWSLWPATAAADRPALLAVPPGVPHWVSLHGPLPQPRAALAAAQYQQWQALKRAQRVWLTEPQQAQLRAHQVLLAPAQPSLWPAQETPAAAAARLLVALVELPAVAPAAASARAPRLPSLAFLSPLPPARSGIADYSAELLPELASHFDITLVNVGPPLADPRLAACFPVIDEATFRATADLYDHVLYQLGNSEFHLHMADLLAEYPGVVVLHDFFLGHMHAAHELVGGRPGALLAAMYQAHGWPALATRARDSVEALLLRYPGNGHLLEQAAGVIVHSAHAQALAAQWLGTTEAASWALIPHLRRLAQPDRAAARAALGLGVDDFVVCSFGFLGPAKRNQDLLQAWQESSLSGRDDCHLVFVGKNPESEYGVAMQQRIRQHRGGNRPRITGFAAPPDYRLWLAAADVAVQLRRDSRGESSGTVLDCLAHGVALVVNAHGSMADLPATAVQQLPDAFAAAELGAALEALHADPDSRRALAQRGREHIVCHHDPVAIAAAYAAAIQGQGRAAPQARHQHRAAFLGRHLAGPPAALEAAALGLALQRPRRRPCWYLDITALRQASQVTGIERVTRALLLELLANDQLPVRLLPVYADIHYGYREAREFLHRQLDLPAPGEDPLVLPREGDLFLGLDWVPGAILQQRAELARWRDRGVRFWFLVHDILPVTNPEWFPAHVPPVFQAWLQVLRELADGCVCVSQATADRLGEFWDDGAPAPRLRASHNGSDLDPGAAAAPAPLPVAPFLLMVGTIEPRKGYAEALSAMEQLWAAGEELHLVIVGREGWRNDTRHDRAPVAALAARLRAHPERGHRLHWLEDIDDAALVTCYQRAEALLAASEDEGFGLPLVEAACFGTPVIARDIPVFREVAGPGTCFYDGGSATDTSGAALAQTLRQWWQQRPEHAPTQAPLSWRDSALRLVQLVLADSSGIEA